MRKPAGSDSVFQWEYSPASDLDESLYELLDGPSGIDAYMPFETSPAPRSDAREARGANASTPAGPTNEEAFDSSSGQDVAAAGMLVPARRGPAPQTRYLLHNLDVALDRWRTLGDTPSLALTRTGIDALASGVPMSEGQASLLLRSALYHRRGITTALRYQDDPERTALILSEAMTAPASPLPPEVVASMREADPNGLEWYAPLLQELRLAATSPDVRTRRRAVDALWSLEGLTRSQRAQAPAQARIPGRHVTLAALAVLTLVAVMAVIWLRRLKSEDLVYFPPGAYLVLAADGASQQLESGDFSLHKFEVTNREYGRCVSSGNCSVPAESTAAGIKGYFGNRLYDAYPVVNVTLEQAEQFCLAQGMRLPTAQEWILAGSVAPATAMSFVYPWGNVHAVQRANTAESGLNRPSAVGSFSPAGDSPVGVSDMAGNVAEWTSSKTGAGAAEIVKGGSYRHPADDALVQSETQVDSGTYADWIGFRCLRPGSRR